MITSPDGRGNEFKKLVIKDIYHVADLKEGQLSFIFDIGANLGFFSVYMRMRHRWPTKVIALEACINTNNYLRQNINMLNIELDERAFGDGLPMYFKLRPDSHMLNNMFIDEEQKQSYRVNSVTLPDLLKDHGCTTSDSYLIKSNCEGGEQYFRNEEAEEILGNALQVCLMYHFLCDKHRIYNWLTFEDHREWLSGILSKDRKILVDKYNLKEGWGIFVSRKNG